MSKAFFEAVGGYDESFTQWGAEDIEFGYRAYTRGGLLVPARTAMCWHQGEGAEPSEAESASLELQRAKISQIIAHRGFRRDAPGRSFLVPQHVVTLRPSDSGGMARLETVEQLLAGSVHDLVVWVEESAASASGGSVEHELLRRSLGGDPRVRFGPPGGAAEAIPGTSFHITVPADARVGRDAVRRLREQLGSGPAAATDPVDHLAGVSIVRAWALHRAARRGLTLAECEAVARLDPDEIDVDGPWRGETAQSQTLGGRLQRRSVHLLRRTTRRLRTLRHFASRNTRRSLHIGRAVAREASAVRSLDDARQFGGWAARSVSVIVNKRLGEAGVRFGGRKAHYRLGPEMATAGTVASAVFARSARVGKAVGPHTRLVVADAPQDAEGLAVDTVALLCDLDPSASVPAFDAETINPSGWTSRHRSSHAALGSGRGRDLDPDRLRRLSRAHHVIDAADERSDPAARAGMLAAAAATGAVVRITEPDPELAEYLGSELYSLMTDDSVAGADAHRREQLSVAMRRCALRDHSLRARARQVLAGTGLPGPALPLVSVLLATRRPHRLAEAVESVAKQTYPNVELVLATHGEGFDPGVVEEVLGAARRPCRLVAVEGRHPLGAVLNAAVAESTGELITKFDDDDFYGVDHLWDLVLAMEYSRDCLVGKAAEFVYLASSDRTVHRFRNRSERPSASLAGGAMMIARHDLDAVLGWREIPAGVDRALIEDVRATGRRVYRTHGMGYMLVRHAEGHTWTAKDHYFLKQADEVRDGCDLAFAAIT